jgi:hypothetical protein
VEGLNIFFQEDKVFEEKMILQAEKTERLTERLNWTPRIFAGVLGIEIKEAYKLLSGEAVNYYTAKAFVKYFKAAFAAAFIDFAAMGMEPPAFLRLKPVSEAVLFGGIAKSIKEKMKKEKQN